MTTNEDEMTTAPTGATIDARTVRIADYLFRQGLTGTTAHALAIIDMMPITAAPPPDPRPDDGLVNQLDRINERLEFMESWLPSIKRLDAHDAALAEVRQRMRYLEGNGDPPDPAADDEYIPSEAETADQMGREGYDELVDRTGQIMRETIQSLNALKDRDDERLVIAGAADDTAGEDDKAWDRVTIAYDYAYAQTNDFEECHDQASCVAGAKAAVAAAVREGLVRGTKSAEETP